MDLTALREQSARVGDQLAVLAEHAAGDSHADGVRDVARWLSTGYLTPELARVLAAAERRAQTPGGEAAG